MNQEYHQDPDRWPVPLGAGLLIETDVEQRETSLFVPSGDTFNLNSATVRVVSPKLDDELAARFLPEGKGTRGTRVIVPEPALAYLSDHGDTIYEDLGFTRPDKDKNKLGELAMIDVRRVVGYFPDGEDQEGESPPFEPWGQRIFLEFDYDDQSVQAVGIRSGKTYGPEDTAEEGEILVPESSKAAQENIATVTKTGEGVKEIETGMRVIPPPQLDSITYKGTSYFFVDKTDDLLAIV